MNKLPLIDSIGLTPLWPEFVHSLLRLKCELCSASATDRVVRKLLDFQLPLGQCHKLDASLPWQPQVPYVPSRVPGLGADTNEPTCSKMLAGVVVSNLLSSEDAETQSLSCPVRARSRKAPGVAAPGRSTGARSTGARIPDRQVAATSGKRLHVHSTSCHAEGRVKRSEPLLGWKANGLRIQLTIA